MPDAASGATPQQASPEPSSPSSAADAPATAADVEAYGALMALDEGVLSDAEKAEGAVTRTTPEDPTGATYGVRHDIARLNVQDAEDRRAFLRHVWPPSGRMAITYAAFLTICVILLVAVLVNQSRDHGAGSQGGGLPAQAEQQRGEAAGGGQAQQGGGGAAQVPAGAPEGGVGQAPAEPAPTIDCTAPTKPVAFAIGDVTTDEGLDNARDIRWVLTIGNPTGKPIALVLHQRSRPAQTGSTETAGWLDGWQSVDPGDTYVVTSEWTRYPNGDLFWTYVDKVAFYTGVAGCPLPPSDPGALDSVSIPAPSQPPTVK